MINTVEYVRETCKKQGIAISQLEQELGFANGYLNPKKLKKIPYDRAVLIADKLGLSVNLLVTGEEQEKPAPSGDNLTEEEAAILNWYRTKASESKKAIIKAIMEDE